jgi:hypothetical protein
MSSAHTDRSSANEKKDAFVPDEEVGIAPQDLESGDAPLGEVTGMATLYNARASR